MSSLTLTIEVDPEKLEEGFIAGETIEGLVNVVVNNSTRCNGLIVSLGWIIEGSGNKQKDKREINQEVYRGEFIHGEEYSFPFSLTIPKEGPFEFIGEKIQLIYYLQATAKIPFGFNPTEKLDFYFTPANEKGILYHSNHKPLNIKAVKDIEIGFWVIILLLLLLNLGIIVCVSVPLVTTGQNSLALYLSLGFTLLFWFLIKIPFIPFKIYTPVFQVHSKTAHPGDPVPFGFSFIPKKNITLKEIVISLICEEIAISGSGQYQVTHKEEVFQIKKRYFPGEKILAGEERQIMDQITLPEDTPYFLNVPSNTVRCTLSFKMSLPYCFSYNLKRTICVIPKGYTTLPNETFPL